jgi:hypothetical protein
MSGQDLYRFKTCISFSAIHTSLHFYWFIISCCVFFSWISPKILAFSAHFFSFHGIYRIVLCSFKFLCFLEYWNIWWLEFLRYSAWKSYSVCVLGWYWYICVIWIANFAFVILGHPIDSCHNTTFFLGLTWSNISLWCYFWKYFCLNLFRNMSSSSSQHNIWQMDPLENCPLLKSDVQIPKVSGLRWAFFPSSCRAFRSIPSDLYQLEVQWW